MKAINRLIYLLIAILGITNSVFAQKKVLVKQDNVLPLPLSSSSYYYIDTDNDKSIEQIWTLKDTVWVSIESNRPVFGFTTDVYWYKTVLENPDSLVIDRIIKVGNVNLNTMIFYHVHPNGEVTIHDYSTNKPLSDRDFELSDNLIRCRFEQGVHEFYINLQTKNVLAVEYEMMEESELFDFYLISKVLYGILIGILIFSILYNIVIYIVVKEESYIYFVINQFFYTFIVLSLTGFGAEYVWSDFLDFNAFIHRFAIYGSGISAMYFIQKFLETKKQIPGYHKFFNVLKYIFYSGIVTVFADIFSVTSSLYTITMLLSVIVTLMAAVKLYKLNYKPARFYIIARSLLLITVFLNFLISLQILPYVEIVVKSHFIAGALEAILISFALADRIKLITYEAEKAKNSQLQEKMRAEEAEFRAKTAELQVHAAEIQARAIEQENERKSAELEQARFIQMSMLPKMPPFLEQYDISMYLKTATEVGGDYYDFFEQSKGDMIIALGDASGHGLTAGVMVTITKTALSFMKSDSLSNLMNQLNQGINQIRPNRMNMAMRLMHISKKKITMSTAAMPDVIYFNAKSRLTELITQPGLPLGAFAKSSYEEMILPVLEKGDVILMVSDGVVEHRNQQGDEYGYKRMQELLEKSNFETSDELIDALLADLSMYQPLDTIEDDLTYMVIKKK